jgi:hypothetical protein
MSSAFPNIKNASPLRSKSTALLPKRLRRTLKSRSEFLTFNLSSVLADTTEVKAGETEFAENFPKEALKSPKKFYTLHFLYLFL